MSMYNLLECSDNCSVISGSLWNYYRNVVNDDENENDNANNNRINNNKNITSKSFEYQTKIRIRIPADDENENDNANNNRINNNKNITSKSFEYQTKIIRIPADKLVDIEVVVPLKYFSNIWTFLNLPLINCEIELDMSWSKNCIIFEISITPRIPANLDANPPVQEVAAIQRTGATFEINNAKLQAPAVTLSINDNIKFLENIKQGFKRTISWKKYRSEITTEPKNNNLDYEIPFTLTFNQIITNIT